MTEAEARKREFKERTKQFACRVIRLYCAIPKAQTEAQVVGRQMLRSGTSVAAVYREASRARSRADFVSKIEMCAQEADETQLWLELLRDACGFKAALLADLWKESDELIAIFVTMARDAKGNA